MKLSLSNIGVGNTPVPIKRIGDYCLLAGAISSGILLYHAQNPLAFFPSIATTICGILAIFGYIGKGITMMAGVTNQDELEKIVSKMNTRLNKTSDDTVAENPLAIQPSPPKPLEPKE